MGAKVFDVNQVANMMKPQWVGGRCEPSGYTATSRAKGTPTADGLPPPRRTLGFATSKCKGVSRHIWDTPDRLLPHSLERRGGGEPGGGDGEQRHR
jgi:hypothetical protein